jgi:hypothetical protein
MGCDWELERRRARGYSVDQLKFAITDAREAWGCAEELVKAGHRADPGKYADQISVYNQELERRLRGGRRWSRRKGV